MAPPASRGRAQCARQWRKCARPAWHRPCRPLEACHRASAPALSADRCRDRGQVLPATLYGRALAPPAWARPPLAYRGEGTATTLPARTPRRANPYRHQEARPLLTPRSSHHRRPNRRPRGQSNTRGVGWDFVHVAIDDATRLAYVEVLSDERRGTATGFLVPALRRFRTRGIRVERVMTDNGSCYRSGLFARELR